MSKRLESLLESALELPSGDRARIAAELIASLDGEPEADVEAVWLQEIDRRTASVARGEAALLDRESVSAEIRKTLDRG